MRIEQRPDNSYVKKPDKVEAYVLRVINRFFETNEEAVMNSREAIIQEAIRRVRPEVVNTIQKIVIDETQKYIQEELKLAIDKEIGHIVQSLYEELYTIKSSMIRKAEFSANIQTVAYEVSFPPGIQVHRDKDIVDVFVNGVLHTDHKYIVNSNGFITKINFHPDMLFEQDRVTVKCIILHK